MVRRFVPPSIETNLRSGFTKALARKIRYSFGVLAILLLLPFVAWPQSTPLPAQISSQDSHSQNIHPGAPRHATSTTFQGLILHWPDPWPTLPFHTFRLWDTSTRWAQLNPSQGQFDWKMLDRWLSAAQQTGDDILFTLGMTPQWASSRPNDASCRYAPGECDPPDDVNADGSGTDQHWKDFVSAVVAHVNGRIHHWEIWNEPQAANAWTGTYAQLARMAQDARSIIKTFDPNSKMLNGGVQMHHGLALKWWSEYAAAGGLNYADTLAIHGDVRTYPEICGVYPQPENFIPLMQGLKAILTQYGQQNKYIWDTEASWGKTDLDCFNNQDLQAAFLARFYLIQLSERIQRFYWRGWIDNSGGLYTVENGLNKAGVAYGQINSWFHGNTMTNSCRAKGTIWTCRFTGPNSYKAKAVWDTSMTCKKGQCGTHQYTVSKQYLDYRTLGGSTIQITNGTVPIGAKPIWIEN
jgi:hypothetical protein